MGTGASRTLGKRSRMKALALSASASRAARIDPLVSIFISLNFASMPEKSKRAITDGVSRQLPMPLA
jgi:hypothetical protein